MSNLRTPHPHEIVASRRRMSAIVAGILLAFVGCAPTAPPTPGGSARPSAVATPGQAVSAGELSWVKLDGIDLRGAFVASGAASASTTVLLGADIATGALASWTSNDGVRWERHWLDGSTFGGGIPQAVIAGGPGFIAVGWELGADLVERTAIWTSVDGIDWRVDPDPSGRMDGEYVGQAKVGSTVVVETSGLPSFHVSEDGLTWVDSDVPVGPLDGPLHLAANGREFVVTHRGGNQADPRAAAWHSRDGRTWTEDASFDAALKGVQGTNDLFQSGAWFTIADDSGGYREIGSDGSMTEVAAPATFGQPSGGEVGLLWLGVAEGAKCATALVRTSDQWHAIVTDPGLCVRPTEPEIWGPLTTMLTGGLPLPDGWLVVGVGPEVGTTEIWSLRPRGTVSPVDPPSGPSPVPPVAAIPQLPLDPIVPRGSCPAVPTTIDAIIALDGGDRLGCFGGRPLTFRAWVIDPDSDEGACLGAFTPAWIQPCSRSDWFGATQTERLHRLEVVRSPTATGDLRGVGRWVTVTGHFDDPAAATCRPEFGPSAPGYPPVGAFVLQCRETFVVTSMTTTH